MREEMSEVAKKQTMVLRAIIPFILAFKLAAPSGGKESIRIIVRCWVTRQTIPVSQLGKQVLTDIKENGEMTCFLAQRPSRTIFDLGLKRTPEGWRDTCCFVSQHELRHWT